MWDDIWLTALWSVIAILILFGLSWLTQKKQVSQCSLFEFLSFTAAGVAAAFLAILGNYPKSITAILLFALIPVLIPLIDSKINTRRTIRDEKPTLLIKDGSIQTANLKKKGMTEAELIIECREQGAEIGDIEFAVLETGGKLHIQKEKSQPMQPAEVPGQVASAGMPRQAPYWGLSLNIIIEGKIIQEHLSVAERDINWILDELKRKNIYDVHEVLLAYFDSANQFFVHTYGK